MKFIIFRHCFYVCCPSRCLECKLCNGRDFVYFGLQYILRAQGKYAWYTACSQNFSEQLCERMKTKHLTLYLLCSKHIVYVYFSLIKCFLYVFTYLTLKLINCIFNQVFSWILMKEHYIVITKTLKISSTQFFKYFPSRTIIICFSG